MALRKPSQSKPSTTLPKPNPSSLTPRQRSMKAKHIPPPSPPPTQPQSSHAPPPSPPPLKKCHKKAHTIHIPSLKNLGI